MVVNSTDDISTDMKYQQENSIDSIESFFDDYDDTRDNDSVTSDPLRHTQHRCLTYANRILDSDDEDKKKDYDQFSKVDTIRTKSNQLNERDIEISPQHSRFGVKEKYFLVLHCALTGIFSIIAGHVYFPVLNVIEHKFNITEEQVNITVVMYFIFQGLSPILVGGLADSLGRRPMVLISVFVYCAACVGLACCNNYAQLVVLRCLQSAGISPVIAITNGIIGDVTTRAERGSYVGYVTGFQVVGSAFGALLGSGISSKWGWRAIFWFLAIGSGTVGVFSFLTLPETKRTIVGNGSIPPKKLINKSPILLLPYAREILHLDNPDYDTLEPKLKISFWAPFGIMKSIEIIILLFVMGLQFMMYTVHQTSLSIALSDKYHLSVLRIGLCYLPAGTCTLISIVVSGKLLDLYYEHEIKKHRKWLKEQECILLKDTDFTKEEVRYKMENDLMYTFNIARVRLSPALVTMFLSVAGFIAFGWCLEVKAPLPAVLVTSGFGSLFCNCILTMVTTLIVDLFPSKASTSTGCINIIRCSLAAIMIACLNKMTIAMNYGGVFTFIGCVTASSSIPLYWLIHRGKKLSFERKIAEKTLTKDLHNESEHKEDL